MIRLEVKTKNTWVLNRFNIFPLLHLHQSHFSEKFLKKCPKVTVRTRKPFFECSYYRWTMLHSPWKFGHLGRMASKVIWNMNKPSHESQKFFMIHESCTKKDLGIVEQDDPYVRNSKLWPGVDFDEIICDRKWTKNPPEVD